MTGLNPDPLQNRPLTGEESDLVRWLLDHGDVRAARHVPDIDSLRVVARCGCGCASVDFARSSGPMDILADYQWRDEQGRLFGVFLFARHGKLSGLEVWSIDGAATPTALPTPDVLTPLGQET